MRLKKESLEHTNTALNAVGILVGILGIAGISFQFFVDYAWPIVAATEFLAVILLLILLRGNEIGVPSVTGIADSELFNKIVGENLGRLAQGLHQAKDGALAVYGDDVRSTQIALINFALTKKQKEVFGVEICEDIDLLFTRDDFWKANKEFILRGGAIRRVFVVPRSMFASPERLRSLCKLVQYNCDIGVQIGLRLRDGLRADLIRDFTLAGTSAVIVEGRQGGKGYELAHSNVYFKKLRVDEFRFIFDSLWENSGSIAAPQHGRHFIEALVADVGSRDDREILAVGHAFATQLN